MKPKQRLKPVRTVLGEVLPVLGTIGLLGLWAFQQIGVETRVSALSTIATGHAIYRTYQSHNAVFNAIIELAAKDTNMTDRIRWYQISNYELGLQGIEDSLSEPEKAAMPPRPPLQAPGESIEAAMKRTQERLEALQGQLLTRESKIAAEKKHADRLYFWAYLVLSVVAVAGAILKAADKVRLLKPDTSG